MGRSAFSRRHAQGGFSKDLAQIGSDTLENRFTFCHSVQAIGSFLFVRLKLRVLSALISPTAQLVPGRGRTATRFAWQPGGLRAQEARSHGRLVFPHDIGLEVRDVHGPANGL